MKSQYLRKNSILFLFVCGIVCFSIFIVALTAYIVLEEPFSEKRAYADLEEYLDIQIPATASNIETNYNVPQKSFFKRSLIGREQYYVRLSFDAPPDDMEKFVSHFCRGRLHQGYTPFNAEYTTAPLPAENLDVHLALGYDFVYYTYSIDTPDTLYGNSCREQGHFRYLLVYKDKSDLYHIIFRQDLDSCRFPDDNLEVPCIGGGNNYINPHPQMPFMIAGMAIENGDNVVVAEGFCIEARTHSMVYDPTFYPSFNDASVDIYIDGQLQDSTSISGQWRRLEPSTEKADGLLFNYCYWDDWGTEIHTMTIDVTKSDNTNIVSQINFRAR